VYQTRKDAAWKAGKVVFEQNLSLDEWDVEAAEVFPNLYTFRFLKYYDHPKTEGIQLCLRETPDGQRFFCKADIHYKQKKLTLVSICAHDTAQNAIDCILEQIDKGIDQFDKINPSPQFPMPSAN